MQNSNTHTATYKNNATGETYKLNGVANLATAWNMAAFVCRRNNWNLEMFCNDVTVKLSK